MFLQKFGIPVLLKYNYLWSVQKSSRKRCHVIFCFEVLKHFTKNVCNDLLKGIFVDHKVYILSRDKTTLVILTSHIFLCTVLVVGLEVQELVELVQLGPVAHPVVKQQENARKRNANIDWTAGISGSDHMDCIQAADWWTVSRQLIGGLYPGS